jgi:autophagy-related protein 9
MGSVYHNHPTQLWGSHYHPNLNAGASTGVGGGVDLVERSREYDRALKASQMVRSRFHPPARNAEDVQQSVMVGMDMAQTAILGDSEGTTTLPSKDKEKPDLDPRPFDGKDKGKATRGRGDGEEEGVEEGISGLGESYVDGAAKRPKLLGLSHTQQQEEDEELLADGGVLGLLAQIYGRKDRTGL